MSVAPNREKMVPDLLKQGFTQKQAETLTWVDFWEFGRDGRGTAGYSFNRRFHCYCKDCGSAKSGRDFVSADSVRSWLNEHIGHNTVSFSKR